MTEQRKANRILLVNTLSFAMCFTVWMMGGVLIAFLVDQRVFRFSRSEMGWLIGAPVLTGSLLRLPMGMLADRFGGRSMFVLVMLASAAGALAVSVASSFVGFLLSGLGFGVAGASFAVGVAYTSAWFSKEKQGTALGLFGAGNVGAAATNLVAPRILGWLTRGGANLDAWRSLPRIYALLLLVMAVVFWFSTEAPPAGPAQPPRTLRERLAPLGMLRVWRFGLYYFLLFGGFVALSQWLIPYYLNLYALPLATAGMLAALFSLPPNLTRAAGGWLADRIGARRVMYYVLSGCAIGFLLLSAPRMDMFVAGQGVFSEAAGTVEAVTPAAIVVSGKTYAVRPEPAQTLRRANVLIWPTEDFWQTSVVAPGDRVTKKQLIAKGVTHIYFQANMWIFTGIALFVGLLMGFGMAAVYRYIPQYFPSDVGTVGGTVGMIGGLGGFVGPVIFGYLLDATGLWITCWMFLAVLSVVCLVWMHRVVRQMLDRAAPQLAQRFEDMERLVPADTVLEVHELLCPLRGVSAKLVLARDDDKREWRCIRCVLSAPGGLECEGHCLQAIEAKRVGS